jgi:hypothetical protein
MDRPAEVENIYLGLPGSAVGLVSLLLADLASHFPRPSFPEFPTYHNVYL